MCDGPDSHAVACWGADVHRARSSVLGFRLSYVPYTDAIAPPSALTGTHVAGSIAGAIVLASSPAQHFFTIFGAALAGFGLIFLLIGWIIHRSSRRFRGPAERTQGTIVGFDTSTPGAMRVPGSRVRVTGFTGFAGSGPLYRPTVQFTTAERAQVTATSPFGSNPRQGHVGDTVAVLYDPRNPQRVRVDTPVGRGSCLEIAFMLFGGGLAALGILILIASR